LFFEIRKRFEQQLGVLGLVADSISQPTALNEFLRLNDMAHDSDHHIIN
jgi:hypothetical protein